MERLREASARWVRAGHITEAQRASILASEAGPEAVGSKTPVSMMLRREGPAAEVFVFLLGGFVALVAALATLVAGDPALTSFIYAGGVLAAVGLALLVGVRSGSLLADVFFAGALWLMGAAAVDPADPDWRYLAPFVAPLIAGLGLVRILRMVIVVPAIALTYVYAVAAVPSVDTTTVFVGFAVVVVVGSVVVALTRRQVRRWVRSRFGKRAAPEDQMASTDPPSAGG